LSTYPSQDVDSPTLLTSVLRYRTSSLVIVAVFGFLGAIFTFVSSGDVSSTASIGLRDPKGVSVVRAAGASSTDLTRYTSERADFARSEAVVGRAAEIDGDISEDDLRARLTTSGGSDSDVIKLTVTASDGDRARDLANAVAQAFEEEQQRNIDEQVTKVRAELDTQRAAITEQMNQVGTGPSAQARLEAYSENLRDIENTRSDVGVEAATFGSGVEFIDAARTPTGQIGKTTLLRNTLAGLIFGAFVAMFVAWLRASSSRVIDSSDVAIAKLDLPLLGEIPDYTEETLARARSLTNLPLLEYQFVASNVSIRLSKGVLVVAGLSPDDGATTTAINVAAAAAVNGQRVALIDGDVRGAGLTQLLGWSVDSGGVLDILAGRAQIADVAVDVPVAGGSWITVLATGSTGDTRRDLLAGEQMWSLLEGMLADYDLIIVDAPPVLSMPDAISLAVHADALAVVVRRGAPSAAVERLHHQIEMLGQRTIGFVFTHSTVAEIPGRLMIG
jgi:Mrp family chromosome partitioning ATPase/capsular polysaccharide biosynthesis protein